MSHICARCCCCVFQERQTRLHPDQPPTPATTLREDVSSAVHAVATVLEDVSELVTGASSGVVAKPAEDSETKCEVFENVKAGKLFNVLDTLLVGTTSEVMKLDDPFVKHQFGDNYIHSLFYQFKVAGFVRTSCGVLSVLLETGRCCWDDVWSTRVVCKCCM